MNRRLLVLDERTHDTAARIVVGRDAWPCREGCDLCCRSLPELPHVSSAEWARLADAIDALEPEEKAAIEAAFGAETRAPRVTCPLLDASAARCRVYEARPVRCRSYGFYADREAVLGCASIAEVARVDSDVVWGNHEALERSLAELGPTHSIAEWFRGPVKPTFD